MSGFVLAFRELKLSIAIMDKGALMHAAYETFLQKCMVRLYLIWSDTFLMRIPIVFFCEINEYVTFKTVYRFFI